MQCSVKRRVNVPFRSETSETGKSLETWVRLAVLGDVLVRIFGIDEGTSRWYGIPPNVRSSTGRGDEGSEAFDEERDNDDV